MIDHEHTRWCNSAATGAHDALRQEIEELAHLLPAQGPIRVFVHHNTLHSFEQLPFTAAVRDGGRVYDCHPYLAEGRYREFHARGRIAQRDLEAVLIDDLGDDADYLIGMLGTRFHVRLGMLRYPLCTAPDAELQWVLEETDALRCFRPEVPADVRERLVARTRRWVMRDVWTHDGDPAGESGECGFTQPRRLIGELLRVFGVSSPNDWTDEQWQSVCLHLLWQVCQAPIVRAGCDASEGTRVLRHRDVLRRATGKDSDRLVHEILIPFCGVFLDQDFASWRLPARDKGFYRAFCALYGSGPQPARWLRGLGPELRRLEGAGISPLESIQESLALLGVADEERHEFLAQTVLALRGWTGMAWQLETNAEWLQNPAPPGTVVEYVACRLVLERLALAAVAREALGYTGPLRGLRSYAQSVADQARQQESHGVDQRVFQVFQLAQLMGWEPENLHRLNVDNWRSLMSEMEAFSALERRRVFHLAYERRYRLQALDAFAAHTRRWVEQGRAADPVRPEYAVMCCIDDREESFRRHLEEVDSGCVTYGVAGFFAVAMYYRGAADADYKPLCPVVVKPQHYVREQPVVSLQESHQLRAETRRVLGKATHRMHLGSRHFLGGIATALLGSFASVPLVARILFPRSAARIGKLFGRIVQPTLTQLHLERTEESPGKEEGHLGYLVSEMVDIVERVLRDVGLTELFPSLIVITGHGSSSLNNPHEAAYDCGACGGGRGGPNARAFAQMANDPRVRQELAKRGLAIPYDVLFVGAYHNTCDDSVVYYDLERLPSTHHALFRRVRDAINAARERNAHERCRRFESADLAWSPTLALRHVEGRAADLSQTRPECGHATNALCLVGRRQWSRQLFLDRRAFLQSYDPRQDDARGTILERILQAVVPVCGGINLEYFFSYVDPSGYGCGTKLPHNVTSMLGVMDGAASDLRPGLPWQMVEIHEPVRLLFVIESTPAILQAIMAKNAAIARLCENQWVQLATIDPESSTIHVFDRGGFSVYNPECDDLPAVASSRDWYGGWRDHLGFATMCGTPLAPVCATAPAAAVP